MTRLRRTEADRGCARRRLRTAAHAPDAAVRRAQRRCARPTPRCTGRPADRSRPTVARTEGTPRAAVFTRARGAGGAPAATSTRPDPRGAVRRGGSTRGRSSLRHAARRKTPGPRAGGIPGGGARRPPPPPLPSRLKPRVHSDACARAVRRRRAPPQAGGVPHRWAQGRPARVGSGSTGANDGRCRRVLCELSRSPRAAQTGAAGAAPAAAAGSALPCWGDH